MGNKIEIDIPEVTRIIGRIDDIESELGQSLVSNNDRFGTLASNIQSDAVTEILGAYREKGFELRDRIINDLEQCKAYLQAKIKQYTEISEAAKNDVSGITDSLNDVESMII